MNGLLQAGTFGQQTAVQSTGQTAYNPALGSPPPDTIMTNANRSARATSDELSNLCARLESLRARLFGHEPAPPAGKGEAVPTPQGAVYELGQEFERHQSLVNRLIGITTDLERLA